MAVEQGRTTGPFAIMDHSRLIADTQANADEGSLKRAVGALDLTALLSFSVSLSFVRVMRPFLVCVVTVCLLCWLKNRTPGVYLKQHC